MKNNINEKRPSFLQKIKLISYKAPDIRFRNIELSGDVVPLIVWNLLPLAGVLFFGWPPESAYICYVLECIVVGVFNLFRILAVLFYGASQGVFSTIFNIIKGMYFIPFYIIWYFGCLYVLLTVFFFKDENNSIFNVLYVIRNLISQPSYNIALGACVLNSSYSFINGFLRNRIYARRTVSDQVPVPFTRVILLFIVGFPAMVLSRIDINYWAYVFLIVFVAFKILVELILRNSKSYGTAMERAEMTGGQNETPLI